MKRAWASLCADGRRALSGLALLAVLLNVLAPPGFMLSPAESGMALVICTGHGAIAVADHQPTPKSPSSKPDTLCPFSGLVLIEPPPFTAPQVIGPAPWGTSLPERSADLVPGRGLAAPPPPSRGPPTISS